MRAFDLLYQNAICFKLTPISIRELFYLGNLPCDIFAPVDGVFKKILNKHFSLSKGTLRTLIQKGHSRVFLTHRDRNSIREMQEANLRKVTRSLSIGSPIDNGKKLFNLMSINLRYLYEWPTNDHILKLMEQSCKNMALFLIDKTDVHEELYLEYVKQKHHFILSQPLISSLFLIGVLKQSRLFSEKEMQGLFVSSYFKDVGMSAIPVAKYDQKDLPKVDREIFLQHPNLSRLILEGRIQLTTNYLSIIENHHIFGHLQKSESIEKMNFDIVGTETILVAAMDIIAAMISGRPYQEPFNLFKALEYLKDIISEDYPQEFKLIVNYFRSFFVKTAKLKK
jgi:HD-GYP domain-containing protein (c-di-GMP phosphodiesterase class II)